MLHKHLFLYFPHAGVLLFFESGQLDIWLISWNLMLSNHSHHVPQILEHYRNLRGTNLPFQESIVARNKQRSRKVYFFKVRLHYHFLNVMLHKHLFLYFPHAGVLLFSVRPSLYDSSAEIWCFLTILNHVPLILEHYRNLRGTNLPFQESIVERNKQRSRKMYFFKVCLHYHFLNALLHKHLFLYFPHAGVLLFLVRPSLYDSSAEIWCFLIILTMYHWYWNITETWEVQTFPFKNQ